MKVRVRESQMIAEFGAALNAFHAENPNIPA